MIWWDRRFGSPGIVAVVSTIILLRNHLDTIFAGHFSGDVQKMALVLVGLFASFPIGYIIFVFFELPFLRFFKGVGFYVKHERLKAITLRAINEKLNRGNSPDESLLARLENYHDSISKMSGRSFFMAVWFSLAPDRLREHCQRRWEEYYIAWGINMALIVSAITAGMFAAHHNTLGRWLTENVMPGLFYAVIIVMLSFNAKGRIAEVVEIENGWVSFMETRISSNIVKILDKISVK